MASGAASLDPDSLRNVLGRRAATVAIATARVGERVHGMTVTAFTEVSLDPPLVLVCADKASHTHPVIAAGGVFALNLLASDQALLSNRFASKKDEERRFEDLPILADALEEAGCDDEDILGHCRSDGEHVRGCWAVDLLLGKG